MAEPSLLVVLPVGAVRVGLVATEVVEVLPMALLQPLPDAPPAVVGSLNLRGQRLPVVDLCAALGAGVERPGPAASIAVVRVDGQLVGLLASDGAPEVVAVDMVRPATPMETEGRVRELVEGDHDVLVIDPVAVVTSAMGVPA